MPDDTFPTYIYENMSLFVFQCLIVIISMGYAVVMPIKHFCFLRLSSSHNPTYPKHTRGCPAVGRQGLGLGIRESAW